MKRTCNTCRARGLVVQARNVASDATGLQWFECDCHTERDNIAEVVRVSQIPIEEWADKYGFRLEDLDEHDEDEPPDTRR